MAKYRFYNVTPDGSIQNNCVTRAISYSSGYSYEEIQEKLYYVGKLLECDSLCLCCYEFLLTDVFKYTPIYCNGMTLNEFADRHPKGLYLVRSNGHISVLDNFEVIDIWDCRDMILTNAWKIL